MTVERKESVRERRAALSRSRLWGGKLAADHAVRVIAGLKHRTDGEHRLFLGPVEGGVIEKHDRSIEHQPVPARGRDIAQHQLAPRHQLCEVKDARQPHVRSREHACLDPANDVRLEARRERMEMDDEPTAQTLRRVCRSRGW